MALAIVPCERNLLALQKQQLDLTCFSADNPYPDSEPDELHALAAELATNEDLGTVEAMSQALTLQAES